MKVRREMLLLAAAASLIPLASPATAQVPDDVVLNIMRECAKIDDPTARLACYDNNIRQAGGTPRAAGAAPLPGAGRAPAAPNTAESFGIDDVRARQPARAQATRTQSGRVDEISTRVSSIREREPGTYQSDWASACRAPVRPSRSSADRWGAICCGSTTSKPCPWSAFDKPLEVSPG